MVRLFDNTLRDGGNVVGHGFPISLTQSIIGALLEAGIPDIECGNCKGLGAYAKADAKQAPSDEEYFEAVQPYQYHAAQQEEVRDNEKEKGEQP